MAGTLTPLQVAALHGIRRVANDQPTDEELAESTANAILDALPIRGWWIDIDGHGEPTVWAPGHDRPAAGVPVARIGSVGPELWDLLAALIPEKIVEEPLLVCGWVKCRRQYNPAVGDADETFCSARCRDGEMRDATEHMNAHFARVAGERA
jgi:hypothetical protein